MSADIRRVLVANRGEIAVRVLRACRQLGRQTAVVVSEADRSSWAAQLADRVVEIGPAPASESYLQIDRVIAAAREVEADAIHPGYGFLSENADFARACRDAGIVFLGPSAEVIEAMGVKTTARERMRAAGVPVVPGARLDFEAGEESWRETAREVGYPLLVKAASGGGGKGMRAVTEESALADAIGAARREAQAAFGDATVYLERQLLRPRHVEVQILGDSHGNVVHVGERDCSVQRRHQKVVEEAPAPGLDPATRSRMHEAAVEAARAVDYVGAGTVEMLLDEDGEFYFLEMNTRLQVEHPVSELISGCDLVAEQIRIGEGRPLSIRPEELTLSGHAFEARLYAEDPGQNFMPQTGEVLLFEPPSGPGIRVDTGIITGAEISLHYDPMVAKICAWGADREQARRRLVEALRETVFLGPRTNLPYLISILEHEAFAAGEVHTGFIGEHLGDWTVPSTWPAEVEEALWSAAAVLFSKRGASTREDGAEGQTESVPSPWETVGPLRLVEEDS